MKRLGVAGVTVLTLTMASTLAHAQGRPDFSGQWRFNQAKSSPGSFGDIPRVSFPSRLVITQSADALHVVMSTVRQADLTTIYKLDGSRVNVETPEGITETVSASWDGTRLVVAGRRSYSSPLLGEVVSEIKELWTLTGNELKVQKTRTAEGLSDTEFAVYDKVAAR